ncbi:MAG: hypothetical protein M1814_001491 [Vezdaea aestivalis]|nr:MAG: hypothetical protein M1814_001491 [Vezdaea aestivalis]
MYSYLLPLLLVLPGTLAMSLAPRANTTYTVDNVDQLSGNMTFSASILINTGLRPEAFSKFTAKDHSTSATCNIALPASRPNLKTLVPCEPPRYQFRLTRWVSNIAFAWEISHAVNYPEGEVNVRKAGAEFDSSNSPNPSMAASLVAFEVQATPSPAPRGWVGDKFP